MFTVTNNESTTVTVAQVTVSFLTTPTTPPAETKVMNLMIPAGTTGQWWFQAPADDVLFDLPASSQIRFSFDCVGFTDPNVVAMSLASHVNPVAGGAYDFPAGTSDLDLGEFWQMNGCTHGVGATGSQSFGYDMGVWGPDHGAGTYGALDAGAGGTQNVDFRCFGKRVLAMADGVVIEAVNNVPNNPAPLSWTSQADLTAKLNQ